MVLIRGLFRLLPFGLTLVLAASAHADVTLTSARTDLLYSQDADPDCSKLHAVTTDGLLPFNVARLRAVATGGPAGVPITYRWSISNKAAGILAADLDLGPAEQNFALNGMCAEFGNECILTKGKFKFYTLDTIFFVAPTCEVLPDNTEKAFQGGTSKIKVKASAGKKKLGHAKITIGWGREGAVSLSAENTRGRFDDGIGKPNGVNVPAVTVLGANVTALPQPTPPGGVKTYFFDGAGVTPVEVTGCPLPIGFAGCVELDIFNVGHGFPTVEARFDDGSALCDKIEVRTGPCSPDAKLQVIPKPRLETYDPDSPAKSSVDLTVRLKNQSKPEGSLPACDFLLRGASVLTCTAEVNVGGVKDTKSTTFDLAHCSATSNRGCQTNSDCSPQVCGECQAGETCLTQSHCSSTINKLCSTDHDCSSTGQSPPCPACAEGETCTRVLAFGSEIFIPAGQSFDLLKEFVQMKNELPDTASIKDSWTANVFLPQVHADANLKYKIRGRPTIK